MNLTTQTIRTTGGDTLVLDTAGHGRPVVLVGALLQQRRTDQALGDIVLALAGHGLRGVVYDRPGRGDSTGGPGSPPPGLRREVDALTAVCRHVGPGVAVLGISSGCAIALATAVEQPGLATDLVLWEPPLNDDGTTESLDFLARLRTVLARSEPDSERVAETIISMFMEDMPPEWYTAVRNGEHWQRHTATAPTLLGDAEAIAWTEATPRGELWSDIRARVTVLLGAGTFDHFADAADSIVRHVPGARRATIPGDAHDSTPADLATATAEALDHDR